MKKARIGIVGARGFARAHLNSIAAVSGEGIAELHAAVIRPQHAELVAQHKAKGVRVYPSVDEMLADCGKDLDIVSVPTGIDTHREFTEAALATGCNVICEKPVAGTVQEARAMIEARDRAGRFVAIHYQYVYGQGVREMKRALYAELGGPKRMCCYALWPRPESYYARNAWAGKLKTNGKWILDSPHNNALAHQLNSMLYLAAPGEYAAAEPLSVQAEMYRAYPIESADTVSLRVKTVGGPELAFVVSHAVPANEDPIIEAECQNGLARWAVCEGRVEILLTGQDPRVVQFNDKVLGPEVYRDAAAVWRGERERPRCPIDLAVAHTICINGSHESCEPTPIPEREIETVAAKIAGDRQRVVRGLDGYVKTAFARRALFSEIGVEWAGPGREVSLRNYKAFGE